MLITVVHLLKVVLIPVVILELCLVLLTARLRGTKREE